MEEKGASVPGARRRPGLRRRITRIPVLGPALLLLYRLRVALRHVTGALRVATRWLLTSREVTNHTYDLTPVNRIQLAAFLSEVAAAPLSEVRSLMRELEEDEELRAHVRRATQASPDAHLADAEPRYARRIGWYVLARLLRPGVVVETGVDKGLGACVLTAALMRNAAEGHPGFYYGTDVNPEAGYLLAGPYARYGKLLLGDSVESLKQIERIDLLVQDSDHAAAYEAREYETALCRLTEGAVVIGDNAHVTDELFRFAERTGRRFLFFAERPRDHWYPGSGIGVAFP